MDTHDEWMYSELLDHLKHKEKEKDDRYYRPIELELPLVEPPPIGDQQNDQREEKQDRGVITIEIF